MHEQNVSITTKKIKGIANSNNRDREEQPFFKYILLFQKDMI